MTYGYIYKLHLREQNMKNFFLVSCILKVTEETVGSGYRSVIQKYWSADPDPYQTALQDPKPPNPNKCGKLRVFVKTTGGSENKKLCRKL